MKLAAAYGSPPNSFINIIGSVIDVQAPIMTSTGSYMFTFKLLDASLRDSLHGSQGLTVRYFKNDLQSMPQVKSKGDVVLLRNIKLTYRDARPMALSNYQTGVLVFPVASIPAPSYQIAYQGDKQRVTCLGAPLDVQKFNSLEEQAYVIALKQEISPTVDSLPEIGVSLLQNRWATDTNTAFKIPANAPAEPAAMRKRPGEDLQSAQAKKARNSSFGQKFREISEVRHYDFADICVQVVKNFPTNYGTCELYVTDYTENKGVFHRPPPEADPDTERDGDKYGYNNDQSKREWPGPYGHLVLKVNLKNPHADFANREVNEGDFLLLRNVKLKAMETSAGRGALEGDMWPDSMDPDKVQIRRFWDKSAPEIQALLERKKRYWDSRSAKAAAVEKEANKERMTHSKRKKLKKQEKAAKAAKAAEKSNTSSEKPDDADDDVPAKRSKVAINPHVRCGHEEVRIKSISEILDEEDERHSNVSPDGASYKLPFINVKYRARARIIDFVPRQLEDFAQPASASTSNPSQDESMLIDYDSSPRYQWSFSLRLECASKSDGPGEQLWVNVEHAEAQYLFGNDLPDPVDLRNDKRLLAKLREKLFQLWGNLEEKGGEEAISNLPFECCLMEYGVQGELECEKSEGGMEDFERAYRLFGVTIS